MARMECHLHTLIVMPLLPCHRGTSKPDDGPGSSQDDEQPGPSRRKRQPSMSETMPLYTLCKEDLESMDKEVSRHRPPIKAIKTGENETSSIPH